MKKFKYLMMSGVVAMLYACGSDSDGGSGSIAGGDGSEQHGLVVIDESKSLIKPYLQYVEEGCFMSGLDFSWKTVELGVDQLAYKYEFVGDTLVLHSGKAFTDHGLMYVGGSNGNLNGTWQSTLCTYDNEEEETTCHKLCSDVKATLLKKYEVTSEDELDDVDREDFDDEYEAKKRKTKCLENSEAPYITIKISGDDITIIEKDREAEEKKEFTDYMNSAYISGLYEAIYNESRYAPSFQELFYADSADVKKYRKRADIEEKGKTEKSVTFIVDEDDTVSVTVNNVSVDEENGKKEVSMVVKSGKRTCELQYKAGRVNKGDCDDGNLAYFNDPMKLEAEDGTVYKKVSYMEDSNEDDFDECVGKILRVFAKNSDDDDDEDPLCTSAKRSYNSCMDYYAEEYSRSYAEDACYDYYYEASYYCGSGLDKTAASTTKLSKSEFKKIYWAQILELKDLFQ